MAKLLYKLGRWSFRRKWVVLVAWVIIIAGVGGSAGALQRGFNDIFNIPGTASEAAADSLVRNFPDQRNPLTSTGVTMVFAAPADFTKTSCLIGMKDGQPSVKLCLRAVNGGRGGAPF